MKYGSEWFKGVANAIRNYGGTTAQINAQDFASALKTAYNVSLKGYFDKNNSTQALFYKNKDLVNYNQYINAEDTENIANMALMFYGCSSLKQANLNMSWCVYASGMFEGCSSLETFENTNTRLLRVGVHMFRECSSLREVRLPTLDITHRPYLTDFSFMFDDCWSLETLVVGYFDAFSFKYTIFQRCYSLKNLVILNVRTTSEGPFSAGFSDCYHFTGRSDATYNPKGLRDGRIYVPDDKVQLVISEGRFGIYSDLVAPLSEYQGEY